MSQIALAAGVALLALSSAGMCLRMLRPRVPALTTRPPVKILERLTDLSALQKKLAGQSTEQESVKLDRVRIKAEMREQIFGQDPVIDDVVDQIWGNAAAVGRTRPLGVFLIAGPSGIGKSQFGKALGEALYGKQGAKPFDMASMDAAHNVSLLFGSAPDHVGGSGELSIYLWANPRSVIVLEEFEKSHRDVQRRFLSAWQDGYFTDLKTGRRVDTTQAIFILTTNACEDQIAQLAIAHQSDRRELGKRTQEALRGSFENSILSRIDYFFAYQPLQKLPFAALVAKFIEDTLWTYRLRVIRIDDDVLLDYVYKYHGAKIDGRDVMRQVESDVREQGVALRKETTQHVRLSISSRKKTLVIEVVEA